MLFKNTLSWLERREQAESVVRCVGFVSTSDVCTQQGRMKPVGIPAPPGSEHQSTQSTQNTREPTQSNSRTTLTHK